jgi:hypothetical protein
LVFFLESELNSDIVKLVVVSIIVAIVYGPETLSRRKGSAGKERWSPAAEKP